ncbi:MAG: hypothetical protein U9O64_05015 [Campylobacterota bacterium]|nr:hypothetical protein [Campylobacterota bacterium]
MNENKNTGEEMMHQNESETVEIVKIEEAVEAVEKNESEVPEGFEQKESKDVPETMELTEGSLEEKRQEHEDVPETIELIEGPSEDKREEHEDVLETMGSMEESIEETMKKPEEKKESKKEKTVRLVQQARTLVQEADEESSACRMLLGDDLKEYNDAKKSLLENGFEACDRLIEKMGYRSMDSGSSDEEVVTFEPKESVKPLVVKEVSGGAFSALFLALSAGAVTAAGLIYLATEQLGMTLDISKMPSAEVTEKIASWFSTLIDVEPNVTIGTGIFGTSVLLVGAVVYALCATFKTNSNLHFAVQQFVESELYAEKKHECKSEMDRVDAHMKETIKTMKTYEVLFNEQKGKLQRILHIEGEKSKATEYHEKSFSEIRVTKELIATMKDFMNIPMSEEGKLSDVSVQRLEKVKKEMNEMIDRLY